MQSLEDEVRNLESEKNTLQVHLAIVENEKRSWLLREAELCLRVKDLESQLAESHRTLLSLPPSSLKLS